jgi:hypothetical protein
MFLLVGTEMDQTPWRPGGNLALFKSKASCQKALTKNIPLVAKAMDKEPGKDFALVCLQSDEYIKEVESNDQFGKDGKRKEA